MHHAANHPKRNPMRLIWTAAVAAALIMISVHPAQSQTWIKKTFSRLSFEVPADWSDTSVDPATQRIWSVGNRNNRDAVFSVVSSTDIQEILGGLKVESKKTTRVGGEGATYYAGTPNDGPGRGYLIVLDAKEPGGRTLALIGSFSGEAALKNYRSYWVHFVASVKPKGAAKAPSCVWDSYTNDPRQFAAQPGGVFPMRRNFPTGKYLVHVGPAGNNGLNLPPAKWRTFGPYDIAAGNKYAAIIQMGQGTVCELLWEVNSARLMMYSKPAGSAVVYVRNEAQDQWYAICLELVGSGANAPSCEWDSYTNDPRQFAAQPGGVFPMRRNFPTGKYLVHVGPAGNNGLNLPPAKWRTFGPYDIAAGNKYAAIIQMGQGTVCELLWEVNSARLMMYSKPPSDSPGLPGYAVVYVRNDALDQWYAICLEPVGAGGGKPMLHFEEAVLQTIKAGGTYTLKARVSNVPAGVTKLKFSWYLHLNECLSADPPGSKANFWYNQIADVRNGEAECTIVMRAEAQKKESSLSLMAQDEPYTKKVFLSTKTITYQIK
jgi:hypothetical protein